MLRELNCNYKGKEFKLNVFSNSEVSDYEILLPERYRAVCQGHVGYYIDDMSPDLTENSIKNNEVIVIVNLDPGIIDYEIPKTEEDAIEYYKNIVANCSMLLLYIENNKIVDVVFSYETTMGEGLKYQTDTFADPDNGNMKLQKHYE